LDVARTGRLVHRAFDQQLVAAGGSLPMWLILIALKGGEHTMQRDLATSIGIEDATLTHHLNRMVHDGLIERHRDPANRRNQIVTLTAAGEALFATLLTTVTAFDRRIRVGFSATELDTVRQLLARLRTNVEEDTAR
jgi:MarR family transcriptional regulator for hemolysin